MAFLDLHEGILEEFATKQNFITVDTVEDFRRAHGIRRYQTTDGAACSMSIHDPRAGHRRYHMMQRVRGRCCACNQPSKTARCPKCTEKRRERARTARYGENYADRKCGCGCGEALQPGQQKFVSATHKARHWDRVKREQKRAAAPAKPCSCGCGVPLGVGQRRFASEACRDLYWRRARAKDPSNVVA